MRESLIALGLELKATGYRFTVVTPETHRRVLARPKSPARNVLHDLFGWNRFVPVKEVPLKILQMLERTEQCETFKDRVRSRIRFGTVGEQIFLHSAFPTEDKDSVFFGPDSYRFVRFVEANMPAADALMDVGCGTGVGGIALSSRAKKVLLADINPRALAFADINLAVNGVTNADLTELDVRNGIPPSISTVISNPPFVVDAKKRQYRDGGEHLGCGLSRMILSAALTEAPPDRQIFIYTGSPICGGEDVFFSLAKPMLAGRNYSYEEIDPDIFGEELSEPGYERADRLAAVGLAVLPGGRQGICTSLV